MREVDLAPYGFPNAVVREDGTLWRRGHRVEPDFNGLVKLIDTEGKQRAVSLAKLVAVAFVPNPNNYPYVRFKDGNPFNYRADNLVWWFIRGRFVGATVQREMDFVKLYEEALQQGKHAPLKQIAKQLGIPYSAAKQIAICYRRYFNVHR